MTDLAVVFDFGGVLFRWQPVAMLQREVPHLAPDTAAARDLAARFFEGYGGDWGEFDAGRIDEDECVARIARRTGLDPRDLRTVIAGVARELQPLTDSLELLQRLHACGVPLYFLSNMPAPVAAQLVAANGDTIARFADGVFSSAVGVAKPDAAIYDLAAERFGVAPERLVFFDDTAVNVDAARSRRWQALRYTTASAAAAELRRLGVFGAG